MVEPSPAGTASVWARPEPATRQPRFSRDQIAVAALEIADAEGFDAVSMRKIAARLGSGTMSLYRYISTKDDLLALLDDALLGEALVPDRELPADWREALTMIARRTRSTLLRHPWAVHALHGVAAAQNQLPGPNGMRHFEQSLAALSGAPLDLQGKLDLLAMVDDYVIGHALQAGELVARLGDFAAGLRAATQEFISAQLASGEFPQLLALSADPAAGPAGDLERMQLRFDHGLRLIVNGVAADLALENG